MLAENKEPLTAIYIGREFNVSSRTIKTYMVEAEDYLKNHGFKLVLNLGYVMKIEDSPIN